MIRLAPDRETRKIARYCGGKPQRGDHVIVERRTDFLAVTIEPQA
jgi:hypothetical protein